jgi:hypothetical protein
VSGRTVYAYGHGNPIGRRDPFGLADTIDTKIAVYIARGNVEELEALLDGEGLTPAPEAVARAGLQRWTSTADQIISRECQARIRGRFPKSVLNNTLKEILELAQEGDEDAQTALKLLKDNRFKK